MSGKIEIPKKKLNFFNSYNKLENKYDEIKYLNQQELSEGWIQVIPSFGDKRLINSFNITLAFLPNECWCKLRKKIINDEETFLEIKHGLSRYKIIETNQDDIMIKLYEELNNKRPYIKILKSCIDELDNSQYSSWLVLSARYYIKYGVFHNTCIVNKLKHEIDTEVDIEIKRIANENGSNISIKV
jgi:hypothetical protein